MFYKMFLNLKKKRLIWLGLIIIIITQGLYFLEGLAIHKGVAPAISQNPNLFIRKNLDQQHIDALETIDSTKYQAILPLPFFHNGSSMCNIFNILGFKN